MPRKVEVGAVASQARIRHDGPLRSRPGRWPAPDEAARAQRRSRLAQGPPPSVSCCQWCARAPAPCVCSGRCRCTGAAQCSTPRHTPQPDPCRLRLERSGRICPRASGSFVLTGSKRQAAGSLSAPRRRGHADRPVFHGGLSAGGAPPTLRGQRPRGAAHWAACAQAPPPTRDAVGHGPGPYMKGVGAVCWGGLSKVADCRLGPETEFWSAWRGRPPGASASSTSGAAPACRTGLPSAVFLCALFAGPRAPSQRRGR
jgi:hypothetical protein